MTAFFGRGDEHGSDHPAYEQEEQPLDQWRFRPTLAEWCEMLERFDRDVDGLGSYVERLMDKRKWNIGEFRPEITNVGGGEMLVKVFWK